MVDCQYYNYGLKNFFGGLWRSRGPWIETEVTPKRYFGASQIVTYFLAYYCFYVLQKIEI